MAILRTEFLEFVNYHLKSLVQSLPSYIEDTTHFVPQLEQMGPLPDDAILATLDVSSLSRTNIPHNATKAPKQNTAYWTHLWSH